MEDDFSEFKNKKLLVVGGAGFVGSNLVLKLLLQNPKEVIIVDNLLSSDIQNVPQSEQVKFVYGSITSSSVLDALPQDLDYVWHLSCYHGNQSSIYNPIADHENNTLTSLKLFDRLKGFKSIKKVVYAAAGCAVAEKTYEDATPTTEDAPISLFHDSPYSISKIVGELYGNFYFQQYGFPFVKARFQNVFGPREILGAGRWRGTRHTIWRNVTPTFIWKSLHGEELGLDNGGKTTRDFIYVDDMARGLMCAAKNGKPGESYNLASGKEISIKVLAETINDLTGSLTPVKLQPARPWDRSGRRFGATEKSEQQIGFVAQVCLRDGLENTVTWTRNNRDRIESCIRQHDYFVGNLDENEPV
ncbi:NAD-dependent epimerase/dehydratase family protein [Alphaproteobacteria bacterium]|nr:NAD-dependent epimerase/dehydratase family protein [Alphaproteobacteria bacterium]